MIYIFASSHHNGAVFAANHNLDPRHYRIFSLTRGLEGLRFRPDEDAVVVLSDVRPEVKESIRRSAAMTAFNLFGSGV